MERQWMICSFFFAMIYVIMLRYYIYWCVMFLGCFSSPFTYKMTHALIMQISRDLATMCSYLVFYSRSLFEALNCLHNKYHIVHGDIKPCNTKFYRDTSSSSLVFKLLDFGMSRCVEQSSAVRCDTGTTAFIWWHSSRCFLHTYYICTCHTLQTHVLTLFKICQPKISILLVFRFLLL